MDVSLKSTEQYQQNAADSSLPEETRDEHDKSRRLKWLISNYWEERGHRVQVRGGYWTIRSNMRNGLPPKLYDSRLVGLEDKVNELKKRGRYVEQETKQETEAD